MMTGTASSGKSDAPALHRIGDNRTIAPADADAALTMIGGIRDIHLSARNFVAKHGLDRDVFLPGNIWAEISHESSFFGWTRNKIDIARAISPFSGFHLMCWARQDDPVAYDSGKMGEWYTELFSGDYAADTLDERLQDRFGLWDRVENSRQSLIERWRALVPRDLPEKFRIKAPPVGGEMGVIHESRILNPDILSHQSRLNALVGAGVLEGLEEKILATGSATFLEIGSGSGTFAHALNSALGGKLRVFLIDLPSALANGCAYLACAVGASAMQLVSPDLRNASNAAYTMIPNLLLPWYESRLPPIDLVHNAISLNEMTEQQVAYYIAFIERALAPDGVFHLSEGQKYLDYHTDALAMAKAQFPVSDVFDARVGSLHVTEKPNSFFRLR